MYLQDDAPLTTRHSQHQFQKQYSNLMQSSMKPNQEKVIYQLNKQQIQVIETQKIDKILSQSVNVVSGQASDLQKAFSPSKQRQESLQGKISEKIISPHSMISPQQQQTALTTQILSQSSPQLDINNETPYNLQEKKCSQNAQQKKEKEQLKSARDSNKQNLINLENVLLVEDKLWTILESFRYMQHYYQGSRASQLQQNSDQSLPVQLNSIITKKQADIALLCEEWWEITHEDNLNYLDRIFKDDIVRRSVRQSIILELLSVTICYAITSEKSNEQHPSEQLSVATITSLKNLLFYTHQNFLVLIDVIIHRLPPESSHNIWAHSLQAILLNKSSKKLLHSTGKSKSGIADNAAPLLIQNNDTIVNILKTLCKSSKDQQMKTQLNKPVIQCTLGLLKKLQKHSVSQIRELLFSLLEQFTTSLLQKQNQVINQKSNIVDGQEDNDYLPVVYPPYLPPVTARQQEKMYTLVLDLDETLIHYFEMGSEGGHFLVRPGAEKFLKEMAQLYEVCIFTAAMQDYADWVLDQLDPTGHIKYRLYRQHATQTGPVFIKDLSKLGRDISRMIIVDNVAENFQLQPDNGIFIRSWFDDMTDTALEELGPLLKEIVRKQVTDVRVALRKFRDQMIEQLEKGISNPIMTLD